MASTGSCSEGSFWTCIPESFRTFSSDEAASLGKNLQCEKVLVIVRQRKKKEMKRTTKPKVTWLLQVSRAWRWLHVCFLELFDWFKKLAPTTQPIRCNTKLIATWCFPALGAASSSWFAVLSKLVFAYRHEKNLYSNSLRIYGTVVPC